MKTHRELCEITAKWLRRNSCIMPFSTYVIIEPAITSDEQPDVFGWSYWTSVNIEVKTSHSDFLADLKKPFRKENQSCGEHRYYFCPKGVISTEEVPETWGLIYYDDGKIEVVKQAERCQSNGDTERTILSSILRRSGLKPQVFNFRNK